MTDTTIPDLAARRRIALATGNLTLANHLAILISTYGGDLAKGDIPDLAKLLPQDAATTVLP